MEKITPRRLFLSKSLMATAVVASLSSTSVLRAFTHSESPFKGYNPFVEEKSDLRKNGLLSKSVTVKGRIYDSSGTLPLSNVTLEVWHLSPNSDKFRHRAKLRTNEWGEYAFITDYPNRETGRIPRIYFKVLKEQHSYFTELSFNDYGAYISGEHWEQNNQLGDQLFPEKETFLDHSDITFNISLNNQ